MLRLASRRLVIGMTVVVACPVLSARWSHNDPAKHPVDCQIPACSDTMDMFKKSLRGVNPTSTTSKPTASSTKSTATEVAPVVTLGCPLDRNELGRSSWDLLHTIAANYPEEPSYVQQQQMAAFIQALAVFYPCIHCALDFQQSIKASPPR